MVAVPSAPGPAHQGDVDVEPLHGATPIAGWFTMEKPMKIVDEEGYPHFRKPHMTENYLDSVVPESS